MLIQTYGNHLQKLVKTRNLLVLAIVVSVLLNLIQAIATVRFSNNTTTVVVPAEIKEPFTIKGKKLSAEYLRQMSDYFAALVLNVTPESMTDKTNSILRYVHPSVYGEMKAYLFNEANNLKRNQQSRFFTPTNFDVDEEQNKVIVEGDETHLIGKLEAFRERRRYALTFSYEHGQLYLNSFYKIIEGQKDV